MTLFVFEVGSFPLNISNRAERAVYIIDFCSNLSSTISNGSNGFKRIQFFSSQITWQIFPDNFLYQYEKNILEMEKYLKLLQEVQLQQHYQCFTICLGIVTTLVGSFLPTLAEETPINLKIRPNPFSSIILSVGVIVFYRVHILRFPTNNFLLVSILSALVYTVPKSWRPPSPHDLGLRFLSAKK